MATQKKKNNAITTSDIDAQINDIDFAVSVGTETTITKSMKGRTVSLNTKAETFFGVGNIWLTSKEYSCKIPETITQAEDIALRNALKRGVLIEGEIKIQPIDRDSKVLDEYWDLIKTYGLETSNTNKQSISMSKFRTLFRNGVDRNWTAKEIARFCYKKELEYKNRDKVLKLLKDTIRYSTCPESLLEV